MKFSLLIESMSMMNLMMIHPVDHTLLPSGGFRQSRIVFLERGDFPGFCTALPNWPLGRRDAWLL